MVLKLRADPPGGWRRAKCAGKVSDDYDPFFEDQDEAVEFCNGTVDGTECPIRHACLLFALQNNERYGVWGGTSELTRKAIRKKFPAGRDKDANPGWEWYSEDDALKGLKRSELQRELDKEQGQEA